VCVAVSPPPFAVAAAAAAAAGLKITSSIQKRIKMKPNETE
jgi:hypothetical protein